MQEKVPAKIQEETKKDEIYVSVKKKKSTIEYEKDLKNLQIELLKFQ
ncbi:polyphosphate kinase 2, partial [Campylobacter coli]|nr:polyphosphate kinase 2 [Campylobacter coli]